MLFFSLKNLFLTLLELKIKINILSEIRKALHVKTAYSSVTARYFQSCEDDLCRAAVLAHSPLTKTESPLKLTGAEVSL